MLRQLEPELMDDPEGAAAYARADFRDSNTLFVDALVRGAAPASRTVVDLGCGPGDLTIQLAQALPGMSFTAVDGSAPMIALARAAVTRAKLDGRVTLVQERLQALPLPAGTFDAVLSKDLLHHLPDPAVLWSTVARLGRPGAHVCVMDLVRPDTPERARAIVDAVVAHADEILRQDFYNSLLAAFTLDEVRGQLAAAGLDLRVDKVSDRHMLIEGRLRAT
jgi:ubiquinone/menaquinone biosynthesis C-methylase UbiE